MGTPRSSLQEPTQDHINLDLEGDDEPARVDRHLAWTDKEDERLASAWLEFSTDPTNGNCRKNDQYWSDVVVCSTTATLQLIEKGKLMNSRCVGIVLAQIYNFHGRWLSLKKVHVNCRSEGQLIEEAQEEYKELYGKGKTFAFMHVWRILKIYPKWTTYCDMLNKKKGSSAPTNVVDLEDLQRPIGIKAAKANHNRKRKMPDKLTEVVEKLDKFIQAHSTSREDQDGMKEFQQRMSVEKLEAANLAHKATKEIKECKLVGAYKELILADTSKLDDDAKAERVMALKSMRLKLFGPDI